MKNNTKSLRYKYNKSTYRTKWLRQEDIAHVLEISRAKYNSIEGQKDENNISYEEAVSIQLLFSMILGKQIDLDDIFLPNRSKILNNIVKKINQLQIVLPN